MVPRAIPSHVCDGVSSSSRATRGSLSVCWLSKLGRPNPDATLTAGDIIGSFPRCRGRDKRPEAETNSANRDRIAFPGDMPGRQSRARLVLYSSLLGAFAGAIWATCQCLFAADFAFDHALTVVFMRAFKGGFTLGTSMTLLLCLGETEALAFSAASGVAVLAISADLSFVPLLACIAFSVMAYRTLFHFWGPRRVTFAGDQVASARVEQQSRVRR